jgi:hypothetical protein
MKIKISALKKFPKSKKFKFTKLPAQKAPDRFSSLEARNVADKAARKKFGTDWFDKETSKPAITGMSTKALTDMATEGYATKATDRLFIKTIKKEMSASRLRTAAGIKGRKLKVKTPTAPTFKQQKAGILKGSGLPKSKPALKMAKARGAKESLKIATRKSDEAFVKITERFTARAKASPFKNRTIATKRPLTGFDGEQAQSAKFIFEAGLEPPNYYKGLSKTGKISKRYARFIDKSKKFK